MASFAASSSTIQLCSSRGSSFFGPCLHTAGIAPGRGIGYQLQEDGENHHRRAALVRTLALTSAAAYSVSTLKKRPSSSSIWQDTDTDQASGESSTEDGKLLYVDASSAEEESDSELDIANLGIAREIVDGLADRGITRLFPIQRAVLEPAMKGVDLVGRARTGTGKTLAFGIPIMDRVYRERATKASSRRSGRSPAALILAPTRELAKQVEKEFMETGKDLATVCVYGGVSVLSQKRALARGVDIVVGTPGRIIDLMDQGSLDLSEVSCMVLDEADQMLAVGFEEDVERIMEQLPSKRQNMLFSATMPSWVQRLSRRFLKSPVTVDLVGDSEEKLAEGIKLYAVRSSRAGKRAILNDVITVYAKGGKAIVFTQTKRDAEEVSMGMNRALGCEALHGDIAQVQREKTLAAFRGGKFSILVATDVAARGLDIDNVDLVVHYDLPRDSETFVHRSGRTGRAGKEGRALVLYSLEERRALRQIERDVGCSFEYASTPQFEDVLKASASQAVDVINCVHPELKDVFLSTAEKLLEEQGTGAFAAAIAHMCGYSQPPATRSLITQEIGWMTLQYTRSPVGASGFRFSVRQLMGVISTILEKAADNIGKVHLIDEPHVEGAVFDLPEDLAKELLLRPLQPGSTLESIKELPKLLESDDSGPAPAYGRSRRPFGRFDNGRAGRFDNGRAGRFDNGRAGRFDNGRAGRFDNSRSAPSYGSRPLYSKSRFGVGGLQSSRDSPGSSSRSFAGTCYKCGKSGHRALDCSQ